MTAPELALLKTSTDQILTVIANDGEVLRLRVISVFDEELEPDLFYEMVSTSKPDRYREHANVGGYSIPLAEIKSVVLT